MSIASWVVQVLLAAAFLVYGATKLSQPKEKPVKKHGVGGGLLAADGAHHRHPTQRPCLCRLACPMARDMI
jgi:hypothetical protein